MATDPTSDISRKISEAKQRKETGDQAFKAGNVKAALLSYHQAVFFLVGLDRAAVTSIGAPQLDPAEQKEKAEIDDTISKIYSNMSACHIKQGNWQRAIETADKALAKNAKNYKAMFRKGKALGEQGFFEKAEKILEQLKSESADDTAAVDVELSRLRVIDSAREKASMQKMKGFLRK
ncbi:hypothetical protein JOM56_001276 [Amanita muscaria]